jgi:nucleoside-diphosphate-sugar epimerase
MRILFVGGTGNISSACTRRALSKGFEVFHLNRGNRPEKSAPGVVTLTADIRNPEAVKTALTGLRFDSVVQFLAYRPEQVRMDLDLFDWIVDQYVLISTCSAYRKPSPSPVITEDTLLENPFWEYSRLKIACEAVLREEGPARSFPYTIVRPSHTYDDGWVPGVFGSSDYTIPWRMRGGKAVVVPGDGQSLWTLTHASDFAVGLVGLLGNPAALSEAFHITSDEHLTWDAIHGIVASALGVRAETVHIPSDYIARILPERGAALLGDKAVSVIFDNSKIRRFVPEFRPSVTFAEGIRRSLAWYEARPELRVPNAAVDAEIEEILGYWRKALALLDT